MFQNLQEQFQSRVCLKIVIGGDCFRLPKLPSNFSELDEIVRSKFENKLPENFCFKYEDSDNDSINVESSSDYEAFLEYCSQEKLRSIKLRIDSKSYKQYFNWYEQQQQQNATNQGIQGQFQSPQNNGVIGMLLNPYNTYYQNMQKGSKGIPANINYPQSFDQQIFGGSIPGMNNPQMMLGDQNFGLMQMILNSQVASNFTNYGLRGSSAIANQGMNNLGLNAGNINNSNMGFNNNTNAVNNSVSSQQQIPTLSKGTSEVNANEQTNPLNFKRQSVNQSYSAMLEQSFAHQQQERRNTSQSGGIGISFAPNIKSSVGKNAVNILNQNLPLQMVLSQQNPQICDLNVTSKFLTQESQVNNSEKQGNSYQMMITTNTDIDLQNIQNPMEGEAESKTNLMMPPQQTIKRTNSMSCGLDEALNPILSNQASFMPMPQHQTVINNTTNNSQNLTVKSSQNLKQNALNSTNVSTNIDTISQTTGGGNMGSNYFANQNQLHPQFGVGNLTLSSYTNQGGVSREPSDLTGKDGGSHMFQLDTSDNDVFSRFNLKREFSPSPPLTQNDTLASSTNNLGQSKINRPSQISTLRSGQSTQVPCEWCMVWDEEQKNNPAKSSDKIDKTPSSNSGKDTISFTPNLECTKCDGTGYLKIEDPNIYNIVQTIMRHKLKEAEIVLKSLQVRQQKVEKIIPKESMDWLQKILETQTNEKQSSKFDEPILSPFTPIQNKEGPKSFNSNSNGTTNFIQRNINQANCCDCKKDISSQKYIYLCIDCKAKNIKSIDVFSKKIQDDVDLDNILCESCEENHDTSHRVVQIQKEDIMTMHSTNAQSQQPSQSISSTPLQRPNALDKSIKSINQVLTFPNINTGYNNINQNYQNTFIRQSEPKRTIQFTQSMGGYNLPQQPLLTAPKNFFNPLQGSLETSTHFSFLHQMASLQQQQSIVQATYPNDQTQQQHQQLQQQQQQQRQEVSQRNSVDVDGLAHQILQKMRSKSDNKSQTTVIKNPHQQSQQFDFEQYSKDDQSSIPNEKIDMGRCSTNHNSFKSHIKIPQLNNDQISSITAKFTNEDEPPTFNDSMKFDITGSILSDNKIMKSLQDAPSNAIITSSPVVSQHPLPSGQIPILETDQNATSIYINPQIQNPGIIFEKPSETEEEKVTASSNIAQKLVPQNQSINIVNTRLSHTTDLSNNDQATKDQRNSNISSSNGAVQGSICVKQPYTTNKLTQSTYQPSTTRPSLTQSTKPDDSRMQYRAKLVNSYCSNDILLDDCVIVVQEICNNGNENWPENVYLKCISGITDNCQYPVIQVNKGEMMSIAFPIKINQNQAADGEQIKTAWRLYHQQQNEERKFFGPKITIDFQYKKPKKVEVEVEESIDFLMNMSIQTISSLFNKEEGRIGQFIKANQKIAEEYLEDKQEGITISKLIIRYIEHYVSQRNKE